FVREPERGSPFAARGRAPRAIRNRRLPHWFRPLRRRRSQAWGIFSDSSSVAGPTATSTAWWNDSAGSNHSELVGRLCQTLNLVKEAWHKLRYATIQMRRAISWFLTE